MLLIQYGMAGSASSWAFRLCQKIAAAAGSDQAELLRRSGAGPVPWSGIRGAPLDRPHPNGWDIPAVLNRIPEDRILVMKTHSSPPDHLAPLMLAGRVRVVATIRDPYDVAASMADKGTQARSAAAGDPGADQAAADRGAAERAAGGGFGYVTGFDAALKAARNQYLRAARWRCFPGVLELPYPFIRAEPAACARLVAQKMGFGGDLAPILAEMAQQQPNFSTGAEGRGHAQLSEARMMAFLATLPLDRQLQRLATAAPAATGDQP